MAFISEPPHDIMSANQASRHTQPQSIPCLTSQQLPLPVGRMGRRFDQAECASVAQALKILIAQELQMSDTSPDSNLVPLRAEVADTECNWPQYELAEVGQAAAIWRFAQLQAVKQTSADSSRLTENGKSQATASRRERSTENSWGSRLILRTRRIWTPIWNTFDGSPWRAEKGSRRAIRHR